MKQICKLALGLIVASLILASYSVATAASQKKTEGKASPSPKSTKAKMSEMTAPPTAGWEQKWQSTLIEAKKEGVVSLYGLWRPETRTALTEAFGKKFGINLEYTPFSRGAEMAAKASTEKTAGLYAADIFGAGGPTLLTNLKPIGLLGQIEPLLILPEVTDLKYWRRGELPFQDADKTSIGMLASKQGYVIYNTNLIKKGELTSYKDLLKPQYKGKITLNDPTVPGPGNAVISLLALRIWDIEEAKDYLRQLVKRQEAVITRDNRIHAEEVARGKYAIGLGALIDTTVELKSAGAAIDIAYVKEGTFVSPGAGGIAVPTKFAHPNAAKIFVNWLLSKEGQSIFAPTFGTPSLRIDVSTEGINPLFLVQPGEKFYLQSEESYVFLGKMQDIAKSIILESQR